MPPTKLTIHPPKQTSSSTDPLLQQPPPASTIWSENNGYPSANTGTTSPVAPAYSPITPKTQPAFPATYPPLPQNAPLETLNSASTDGRGYQPSGAIAPNVQYIPHPAPQPFSSEDSSDAIALRAAISTLQFQRKKAQEDIKALEDVRKRALDEPELFKSELAAGRLKEQKPKIGDLQNILDQGDSDEEEEDKEAVSGAAAEDEQDVMLESEDAVNSQMTSDPTVSTSAQPTSRRDEAAPFSRIPGPQNVVRMPHINWEKYHIQGEALDRMHEQQRRWPGTFEYGQERGREFTVAAPYNPWLDAVDGQQDRRKDSVATPGALMTPTVSEHPMETRRSKNQ